MDSGEYLPDLISEESRCVGNVYVGCGHGISVNERIHKSNEFGRVNNARGLTFRTRLSVQELVERRLKLTKSAAVGANYSWLQPACGPAILPIVSLVTARSHPTQLFTHEVWIDKGNRGVDDGDGDTAASCLRRNDHYLALPDRKGFEVPKEDAFARADQYRLYVLRCAGNDACTNPRGQASDRPRRPHQGPIRSRRVHSAASPRQTAQENAGATPVGQSRLLEWLPLDSDVAKERRRSCIPPLDVTARHPVAAQSAVTRCRYRSRGYG